MDSLTHTLRRHISPLQRRDTSSNTSPTVADLLISLISLLALTIALLVALYMARRIRRNRAISRQQLPFHNTPNHHRDRLTITTTPGRSSTLYVFDEKSSLSQQSPPPSPDSVPEIRITFPDEQDESGRHKSGRVVVVRVGEHSVGLEPLDEEQLPAYEREGGFHSIDMDRIGGLKEKSNWS